MSANHDSPSKERIKLVEPAFQLRKPQSPGSGLKFAGALVLLVILLLWFYSSSDPKPLQLSPQEGAAAADQVEQLTKELSERAREAENAKMKKMSGGTARTLTLNEVQFTFNVPSGWSLSDAGRQKFVRKNGDARICQLTADKSYDTKGLIAEVRGKEVAFEAQYMKEALGMAVPKEVRIEVGGNLLHSSYGSNSVNYIVRTRAKMIANNRGIEQTGINSTYAVGRLMVRMQCMNMAGTSDDGGAMETMGRSLKLTAS